MRKGMKATDRMMISKRVQLLFFALLIFSGELVCKTARAEETSGASKEKPLDAAQCVSFHTEGQRQSQAGDLRGALASFTSCSSESCPSVISSECLGLRESAQERLPTVIFSVTSPDGEDLTDYQVQMDGQVLLTSLDGRAIPVNPGSRKITFIDLAGEEHEQEVVFREGEKARRVDYQLEASGAEPVALPPAPTAETGFQIHPLTWIGGGVAVVGTGTFAALAIAGKGKERSLKEDCAPACSDDQVGSVKTMFLAADIALGVGIAGAAAALVGLFLPGKKQDGPSDRVSVSIHPGSNTRTVLHYRGRF